MRINEREIGGSNPPYIIAEASCCHVGSLENAKRLIRAAKRAGADAIKFQAYTADTITLNYKKLDFMIQDGLWKGQTLYDLYKRTETPFEWFPHLFRVARKEGITLFASVFDTSSVDMLESLDCPAYKIASFEIVDTPLISYTARLGRPMIISTGMASDREILDADEASKFMSAFLHCTSEYPGTVEGSDLGRIHRLDTLLGFKSLIGISDHTRTPAWVIPVAATALRVAIIEKHLKLEDVPSEDDAFSLTPSEFAFMVKCVQSTHEGLAKQPSPNGASRSYRRSLYAVKDIAEGDTYTTENIRSIRPGYGLPPKLLPRLIGKNAKRVFKAGEPLS